MRRVAVSLAVSLALAFSAFAGFKVKLVKPKKPEQFQTRATVAGVTYAADLLLDGGDQKDYFYKELTPSDVIAVRLAVFNRGKESVQLTGGVTLSAPDGSEVPLVGADTVARAILQGLVVSAEAKKKDRPQTAQADPRINPNDPRISPNDPRINPNDPRINPNDPRYDPNDPRINPNDPRINPNDPRYDPNDPRYDPRYGRGGGYGLPTIILNPGGGSGGGDLTQFEKQLVEKDFQDKSHSTDPIEPPSTRDRFLYFSLKDRPASVHGFTLRVPEGKGIPEDVVLKF